MMEAVHRTMPTRLLGNVTYTGAVNDKGEIYHGEHEAIIETPLWREVNQLLSPKPSGNSRNSKAHHRATGAATPEPIARVSRRFAFRGIRA
jgi:hypothetical protein